MKIKFTLIDVCPKPIITFTPRTSNLLKISYDTSSLIIPLITESSIPKDHSLTLKSPQLHISVIHNNTKVYECLYNVIESKETVTSWLTLTPVRKNSYRSQRLSSMKIKVKIKHMMKNSLYSQSCLRTTASTGVITSIEKSKGRKSPISTIKSSIYNFYNNLTHKKNSSYDNLAYPIYTSHVNEFTFKETSPCSNKKDNNVSIVNEESNSISYDTMRIKFSNDYTDMYIRSIPDNVINLEVEMFFERTIGLFDFYFKEYIKEKRKYEVYKKRYLNYTAMYIELNKRYCEFSIEKENVNVNNNLVDVSEGIKDVKKDRVDMIKNIIDEMRKRKKEETKRKLSVILSKVKNIHRLKLHLILSENQMEYLNKQIHPKQISINLI